MPEFTGSNAPEGLGEFSRREWPRPPVVTSEDSRPIDFLKPKSRNHDRVLRYLMKRLDHSEREMAKFYPRWQVAERKMQAFISLPEWEEQLRTLNRASEAPRVTRIVVPYSFATLSTIVTFLMHAFTGRKPMFQVGSWKDETIESAQMMEQKLQYDAEHTKLVKFMHQFLQDSQIYGVSILRCLWDVEVGKRTVRRQRQFFGIEGTQETRMVPIREEHVTYEGNRIVSQDPFMFFPDPRVPMSEVNKRGEYVFWRTFEGRHILKRDEADGDLKWVDDANRSIPQNTNVNISDRSLLSEGEPHPGFTDLSGGGLLRDFVQVDQGTIDIIPRELGLGESSNVEKWIFTILNKSQIVQAEEFDSDHEMHPVAVAEPYGLGYGFGEAGMLDYLAPIQDTISWFFNSHIDNVRKVLNDMLIVDPSMVEMQDLLDPEPGKLIRLKRASLGTDVRQAVHQLNLVDVTQQHVSDANEIMRMGQFLSAVNDNILGLQDSGGRKTATESRQATEAAGSRLSAQARIISAHGITDLTKMMSLNNQQHLTEEFYMMVVGEEGRRKPLQVTPEQLVGDFYYPINDGTLPMDRVAMMDVWREVFAGILGDQELRSQYSVGKIFEHIAELGGARNIESFRLDATPDAGLEAQVQQGNVIPISQAANAGGGGGGGRINALPASPGRRVAESLAS